MATVTASTKNLQTLNSIFEHGLVPANQVANKSGMTPHTSYDQDMGGIVSFNCITKIEGIVPALFDPAKGAFTIALERKGDELFSIVKEAKKEELDKKVKELQNQYNMQEPLSDYATNMLLNIAYPEIVGKNPNLVETLTKRVHRSALLVFESNKRLTYGGGDGCDELSEKFIANDKVKYVILRKAEFETELNKLNFPKEKILFVEDITTDKVVYVPNRSTRVKIPSMQIPNYQDKLKEIASKITSESGGLANNPIYTHVVRLRTDDEV